MKKILFLISGGNNFNTPIISVMNGKKLEKLIKKIEPKMDAHNLKYQIDVRIDENINFLDTLIEEEEYTELFVLPTVVIDAEVLEKITIVKYCISEIELQNTDVKNIINMLIEKN